MRADDRDDPPPRAPLGAIDEHAPLVRADVLPPIIVINVNETNLVNLSVRVIDGKVRILRELHEEINIGSPIDTTGILFKFYPYSQVLSGQLKLTSDLKVGLLRQSFDFLPNATGMTLYTQNGDSLGIDGQSETANTNVVLSPEINWAMATGSNGTFLNLFEMPVIGTTRRFYYRDAQSGTNDGTTDTGDGKSYGDNGLWITGTTITGEFRLALTSYYLPANQPPSVGAQLRDRTRNPVNVNSQSQTFDNSPPSAVRDLHIDSTTLTSVTLAWSAPSDAGSTVVSYQLAYSTTATGNDTTLWFDTIAQKAANLPAPAPPSTVQAATVPGLTTGAKYFFILRSVDDFGNLSGFSNVATIDAVPVELVSFTGRAERNRALLLWQTASETNNLGFAIERSERRNDADEWRQVGFVAGHGTTTLPQSYRFEEDNLQPGTYYYRLKQIDTDGAFAYTEPREIVVLAPQRFSLSQNYPNPLAQSAASTVFQYELPEAATVDVTLRVFNILGQEVRSLSPGRQSAGYYKISWDGRNERDEIVPTGIYFYQLTAGLQRLTRKLAVVQ